MRYLSRNDNDLDFDFATALRDVLAACEEAGLGASEHRADRLVNSVMEQLDEYDEGLGE